MFCLLSHSIVPKHREVKKCQNDTDITGCLASAEPVLVDDVSVVLHVDDAALPVSQLLTTFSEFATELTPSFSTGRLPGPLAVGCDFTAVFCIDCNTLCTLPFHDTVH